MSLAKSDNKNFSMSIRKNLKEYEPKWVEECKKLEAVLGFPVEFEFHTTPEELKTAYRGYDERAGELAYSHLSGAVEVMLEDLKDDMVKEGFIEAFTAKKIILVGVAGVGGYNARWAIKDGVFRIEYEPANLGNNCAAQYVRSNNRLEKLL